MLKGIVTYLLLLLENCLTLHARFIPFVILFLVVPLLSAWYHHFRALAAYIYVVMLWYRSVHCKTI